MGGRVIALVMGMALLVSVLGVALFVVTFLLGTPDQQMQESFVAPSGERTLYLLESCEAGACTHEALIELPAENGNGALQVRCGLDIVAEQPVFDRVEVDWAPEETAVLIRYGIVDEEGPVYALDFERDCNA